MLAMLTAIRIEYEAVRAHLTNLGKEKYKGTIYQRGSFIAKSHSWDVILVETGIGNVRAAVQAERVINFFNPSLILFVGVAGGLKNVNLGDVVVASKVYAYEFGKANVTFQMRPEVGNPSFLLVQLARAEAREKDWLQRLKKAIPDPAPRVLVAPIAAGESVVSSTRSSLYQFLRKSYDDAIAVEMEGHGFFQAGYANPQVDALSIRGISDLINRKKRTDAASWQETAALHASAFAFEVLEKLDVEGFQQNDQNPDRIALPGEKQAGEAIQHVTIVPEEPQMPSLTSATERLLHEFRTAIPEHAQKLKRNLVTFDGGRDISRSAIKLLDGLDGEVKRICEEAPALSFLDLGRLQNIQAKITMLKSELEPFRHLRPWMYSRQRREIENKCEQIRQRCRELLADLDQFRRQR